DVLTSASEPSVRCTSQPQPEPKVLTAVSLNCSLNVAKSPIDLLIAWASLPVGSPPPFGPRQLRQKVWFHTWAALLIILPCDLRLMCSSGMSANSVPSIILLRLST